MRPNRLVPALLFALLVPAACSPETPVGARLESVAFWRGRVPENPGVAVKRLAEAPFETARGTARSFGFAAEDVWVRLSLSNSAAETMRFVVRSGAPRVDSVRLLTVLGDGSVQWAESGEAQDMGDGIEADRMPSFQITINPGERATAYLRFRSHAALTVDPQILSYSQFQFVRRAEYLALGIGFGIVAFLILFSLILWRLTRSPTYGFYSAYLICICFLSAAQVGFAREALPRDYTEAIRIMSLISASLAIFAVLAFSRRFLSDAAPALERHAVLRVLRVLQWFAVLALATLPLDGIGSLAGRVVNALGAIAGVFVIAAGILAVLRGLPEARFFLVGWSFVLVGLFWRAATLLQWIPVDLAGMYGFQVGTLAENLCFAIMLGVRHRRLDTERILVDEQLTQVELELSAARRIHSQLLVPPPQGLPFDVALSYLPHSTVGGDFYAFHKEEDGRLIVLVADVSGRGLSAALGAAAVRLAFLNATARAEVSPGGLLALVGDYIAPYLDGRLVLGFCLSVDYPRRVVQVAVAGGSPGIRVEDRRARVIEASGPPLGYAQGHAYEEETIDLGEEESRLFFFTDGLLHSVHGRPPGEVRTILLSMAEGAGAGESDFVPKVLRQLSGAEDGSGLTDDATILEFRFPRVSERQVVQSRT